MPKKPSKGQQWTSGRRSEDKHYYVHDDRGSRATGRERRMESDTHFGGNRPRVSFKNQSVSKGKRDMKHLRLAIQANFDDDVAMGSSTNNSITGRSVVYRGRGRGSLMRGRDDRSGGRSGPRGILSPANCYKVHIPYGSKFEKHVLIGTLLSSIAPETFTPIMYKIVGQDAVFHVDELKVAQKLLSCDRKITLADGFKIVVKVHPYMPESKIDAESKNKIKQVLDKRYIKETNAMNLSSFHLDSDLVDEYYFPLFRPTVFPQVLDIVAEALPTLRALNLDGNKLSNVLEKLRSYSSKFQELKILYLGNNKISNVNQLDYMKNFKLEELKLLGNPICDKYKNRHDDYVSDVRRRFPSLKRLDGVDLPPTISFDLADEGVKLPPTQRICVANPNAREIVNRFLQQYYVCYDGDSRQSLLDAYQEHASFSLTIAPSSSQNKFSRYNEDNRNLFRVSDSMKRGKLLKQGKLPIVTFLTSIPKTQHFLDSFTMDIGLVTDNMMLVTVTGLFKEVDTDGQPIRFFHRTFIIVPQGGGYCIQNEILHLAHPTSEQEKRILNPTTAPPVQQVQQGPSTSAPAEPSLEIQQQMTLTLSNATNMNLDWSFKCLRDVQWNYDTALAAFQEFFKLGRIPPDAFKK